MFDFLACWRGFFGAGIGKRILEKTHFRDCLDCPDYLEQVASFDYSQQYVFITPLLQSCYENECLEQRKRNQRITPPSLSSPYKAGEYGGDCSPVPLLATRALHRRLLTLSACGASEIKTPCAINAVRQHPSCLRVSL